MSAVDNRIVQMEFDNRQFEKGVSDTIRNLSNLDSSINHLSSGSSLDGLASNVQTVADRFSVLGNLGFEALNRITTAALDAGEAIIKSLTITPALDGFAEYEQKINAVQVILSNTAGKGTTLDDVERALGELNEYADKTIYNFGDMTDAVGKFTAAGNDLDESVNAIKGLSNVGAALGAGPNGVSRVMTQFSQSLSSGRLMLQDWNSAMYAGMAGPLMTNGLLDAAYALGEVDQAVVDMIRNGDLSFREAIKANAKGEAMLTISSEAMIKAFNAFANDESMTQAATQVRTFTQLMATMREALGTSWGTSWEHIIGDKDEAAALFTSISDGFNSIIGASNDARNEMLKGWKESGGRDQLIEAFSSLFGKLRDIMTAVGDAWQEVFPPWTTQTLLDITDRFKDWVDSIEISQTSIDGLKGVVRGVAGVFKIFGEVIGGVVGALGKIFEALSPIAEGILSIAGAIGNAIATFAQSIQDTDAIQKAIDAITGAVKVLGEWIGNALVDFGNFIKETDILSEAAIVAGTAVKTGLQMMQDAFKKLFQTDLTFFDYMQEKLNGLGEVFEIVFAKISEVWKEIEPVFVGIWEFLKDIGSKIGEEFSRLFSGIGIDQILEIIKTGVFTTLMLTLREILGSIADIGKEFAEMIEGTTKVLDSVRGSIEAYQNTLKADIIKEIAQSVALLVGSIWVLTTVDTDKALAAVGVMSVMFAELIGSLAILNKISTGNFLGSPNKMVLPMLGLATSLLEMSYVIANIAELDWEDLAKGISGMIITTGVMVAGINKLDSGNLGKTVKSSLGMLAFSTAILKMADTVKKIAELGWEEMAKGLTGLTIIAGELIAFVNTTNKSKMSLTKGAGIFLVSVALEELAKVVNIIGSMDTEKAVQGIAGLGFVVAELAILMNSMSKLKNAVSTGAGLMLLGAGLLLVSEAVSKFGSIDLEKLATGLVAMGAAILEIALAARALPENMVSIGFGLIEMSAGLLLVAEAMEKFGGMSWQEIAKGLVAIGGALVELAIASNLIKEKNPEDLGIVIIAAALRLITPAFVELGSMDLDAVGKGLLALGGILIEFAATMVVLSKLAPLKSSALLGVGAMTAVIGVLAMIFEDLAKLDNVADVGIIAGSLAGVLGSISLAIAVLSKIPASGALAAVGDVAIFVGGLVAIVAALGGLYQIPGMEWLMGEGGKFLAQLGDILGGFVGGIAKGFLEKASEAFPELAKNLSVFMLNIKPFLSGIKGIDESSMAGVKHLADAILTLTGTAVLDALTSWFTGGSSMSKFGQDLSEFAVYYKSFYNQIKDVKPDVVSAASNAAKSLAEFANNIPNQGGVLSVFVGDNTLAQFAEGLSAFADPFVQYARKMKSVDPGVVVASSNAAKTLSEFASSLPNQGGVLSMFAGDNTLSRFADELTLFGPAFAQYSQTMKGVDTGVITATSSAATSLAEFAKMAPSYGGLNQLFSGDNRLSLLAKELDAFAPAFVSYSDAMENVKSGVITATSSAAKSLFELASLAPSYGGLSQLFSGDNRLSLLARDLPEFGTAMAEYGVAVADIKPYIVKASADAAQAIAELAAKLPKSGGLSSIFGGEQNIQTFGNQLAFFGKALYSYYTWVANIKFDKLKAANTEIGDLISLAERLAGIDASVFTNFANDLAKAGNKGVDAFINAFNKAGSKAKEAVTSFIKAAASGLRTEDKTFEETGKYQAENFIGAIKTKNEDAKKAAFNLLTSAQNGLHNVNVTNTVKGHGNVFGDAFIRGIGDRYDVAFGQGTNLGKSAENGLKGSASASKSVGESFAQGFINGMNSKSSSVSTAASAIGKAAVEALKKATDTKSPSREAFYVGEFFDEGFVQGMLHLASSVYQTSHDIGVQSLKELQKTMSDVSRYVTMDLETAPIIRPLFDSTNIDQGIQGIASLFNKQDYSIGNLAKAADAVAANQNGSVSPYTGQIQQPLPQQLQFVQNNYSPRSLTLLELYRQTNNQFTNFTSGARYI